MSINDFQATNNIQTTNAMRLNYPSPDSPSTCTSGINIRIEKIGWCRRDKGGRSCGYTVRVWWNIRWCSIIKWKCPHINAAIHCVGVTHKRIHAATAAAFIIIILTDIPHSGYGERATTFSKFFPISTTCFREHTSPWSIRCIAFQFIGLLHLFFGEMGGERVKTTRATVLSENIVA